MIILIRFFINAIDIYLYNGNHASPLGMLRFGMFSLSTLYELTFTTKCSCWSHEIAQSLLVLDIKVFFFLLNEGNNFEDNRQGGTLIRISRECTTVYFWQFVCEIVFHRNNSYRECKVRDDV